MGLRIGVRLDCHHSDACRVGTMSLESDPNSAWKRVVPSKTSHHDSELCVRHRLGRPTNVLSLGTRPSSANRTTLPRSVHSSCASALHAKGHAHACRDDLDPVTHELAVILRARTDRVGGNPGLGVQTRQRRKPEHPEDAARKRALQSGSMKRGTDATGRYRGATENATFDAARAGIDPFRSNAGRGT